MKMLSRDFTLKEKILILILVLVLLALAYYQFVDQPIRSAIQKAESETSALEIELNAVNLRLAQLTRMQNELNGLQADETVKRMPSYNNEPAVNSLLNNVLGGLVYNFKDDDVTRGEKNLIRRNVNIQFVAPDYETVERVLTQLSDSDYRCLLENVKCESRTGNMHESVIQVTASLTFYETMVGGKADVGLPDSNNATPR